LAFRKIRLINNKKQREVFVNKYVEVPIVFSGKRLPELIADDKMRYYVFPNIEEPVILKPRERKLIPTGMKVALPRNHEMRLYSTEAGNPIVLNEPATIDSCYRGDVGVILFNKSHTDKAVISPSKPVAIMTVNKFLNMFYVKENDNDSMSLLAFDEVEIRYTSQGTATRPSYETSGAAGADVYSSNKHDVVLKADSKGSSVLVRTDMTLFFEDKEIELSIRPRSGYALKNGVTIASSKLKSGEDLVVKMINVGTDDFIIQPSMRIAQLVCSPKNSKREIIWSFVNELDKTDRGEMGFGSTNSNKKDSEGF
jgi:dUTP pyrophosphatase